MLLAHGNTPDATTVLAPGGPQLVDAVVPCLIGATADDPLTYELGALFRPAAIGVTTAAVLAFMLALILGKRVSAVARIGVLSAGIFLLLVSAGMGVLLWRVPTYEAATAHVHADFAVVVRGAPLDFSAARFQSDEGHILSDYAHFHGGDGTIVHGHAAGVTYGYFLWSIGVPLRGSCMMQPDGQPLCNDGAFRWIALVDGVYEPNLRDRPIGDLERVLLAYTDETEDELRRAFSRLVTDEACIASDKCPERGKPDPEGCG